MNQIKIDVRDKNLVAYTICMELMRREVYNGAVYAEDEILVQLSKYMDSMGIPFQWKSEGGVENIGYTLTLQDEPIKGQNYHIVIDKNGIYDSMISRISSKDVLRIELSMESGEEVVEEVQFEELPIHLKNEQIKRMFLKCFEIAEQEIDIISPWMSFQVVDAHLLELMEKALNKGVYIKIIYGLKPYGREYDQKRSNGSDQVAEFLMDKFKGYGKHFVIRRDNIHYKLVLCDEKIKLEGGYNYLSFTGDYIDEDTRREGSPLGRDAEEIRYLRKEYFSEI